tara:strand:- start:2050 stop:2823 length:774 start_codon:yes stop_codon:yes gene_type:complete
MINKKEIKYLASLQQKKFRLLHKQILIEGSKLILEALKHNQSIVKIIYSIKDKYFSNIRKLAIDKNIPLELCSNKDAQRISNTKNSQQIFAQLDYRIPQTLNQISSFPNDIILIDGLADPGNLGTILRTGSWFGYYNLFLTNETVELYNPKTIRAGMGAHFHLQTVVKDKLDKIIDVLKKNDFNIIAANLNGAELNKMKLNKNKNWCLILGNEAHGLSKNSIKFSNSLVKIDGENTMESLNVAEAASIIMHHIYKGK